MACFLTSLEDAAPIATIEKSVSGCPPIHLEAAVASPHL